jgi:hypothetical protein
MVSKRSGNTVLLFGMLSLTACPDGRNNASSSDGAPGIGGNSDVPWASNAGQVARFEDETPLGPNATVMSDGTVVRKSPESGAPVATLSKGTTVIELSTRNQQSLITFDDPKGGDVRLIGWVSENALTESSPPSPVPALAEGGADDADVPPSPSPSPSPTPGKHHHRPRPRPHP